MLPHNFQSSSVIVIACILHNMDSSFFWKTGAQLLVPQELNTHGFELTQDSIKAWINKHFAQLEIA